MRIQHIGLDPDFIENLMQGPKFEQACNKVLNTVKFAAINQQRQQMMKASISRGNLSSV